MQRLADRQIDLLDPPAIVALGLSAAKWFLGPRTVLARAREHGGRPGTDAAST